METHALAGARRLVEIAVKADEPHGEVLNELLKYRRIGRIERLSGSSKIWYRLTRKTNQAANARASGSEAAALTPLAAGAAPCDSGGKRPAPRPRRR